MSSAPCHNEFLLNGRPFSLDREPPHKTLLQFIREAGFTGSKEVCAEGECGACTVLQVAERDGRTTLRPVNSCLVLLPSAIGHEIYTAESVAANGRLGEVQEAIANAGGSQCGYCTPGFVMALLAEQHRPGRVGPCDPEALAGNLCRCTGYRPIRDAALSIGPAPVDRFSRRLKDPAPVPGPVRIHHQTGRFSRPVALRDCLSLLGDDPEAKVLAGGTDVAVEVNLRDHRWSHLISLEAVPELADFRATETGVRIGAALPLAELEFRWKGAPDFIRDWLRLFGSPQIRNRATLGGSLGSASPVGDAAPLLMALDAQVHIAGPRGDRVEPVASLFAGYRRTTLEHGELIAAVEIPLPVPAFFRFYKVARRRTDDISAVAAAMAFDCHDDGAIRRARFAFGGVAATPVLLPSAETAVLGYSWTEDVQDRVGTLIERELQPMTDHRASAAYRSAVVKSLVEKFWWEWHKSPKAA